MMACAGWSWPDVHRAVDITSFLLDCNVFPVWNTTVDIVDIFPSWICNKVWQSGVVSCFGVLPLQVWFTFWFPPCPEKYGWWPRSVVRLCRNTVEKRLCGDPLWKHKKLNTSICVIIDETRTRPWTLVRFGRKYFSWTSGIKGIVLSTRSQTSNWSNKVNYSKV